MIKKFLVLIPMALAAMLPLLAEDWTTTDGKTYKGVTVVKVEDDAVTILDDDGGARLNLSILTPDLQKRFNYDPAKAQAAADGRAKADAANAKLLQAEINQSEAMKRTALGAPAH